MPMHNLARAAHRDRRPSVLSLEARTLLTSLMNDPWMDQQGGGRDEDGIGWLSDGAPASVEVVDGVLVIEGTTGDDTVVVAEQDDGAVTVELNGDAFGPFPGAELTANRVRVGTHDGNDTVDATGVLRLREAGALVIEADLGAGDDSIASGRGWDVLDLGPGDDTAQGNGGWDLILGGDGSDVIRAQNGNDTIDGGPGRDTLVGGADEDSVSGGDGDDSINGDTHADILLGGLGNDTIFGRGADDTILGGRGDDSIRGGNDVDAVYGGWDDDRLEGNNAADLLDGGPGSDLLFGGRGFDTLLGGDGDDTLDGWNGVNELDGGPGADVYGLRGEDVSLGFPFPPVNHDHQMTTEDDWIRHRRIRTDDLFIHADCRVWHDAEDRVLLEALGGNDILGVDASVPIGGTLDGGDGLDFASIADEVEPLWDVRSVI